MKIDRLQSDLLIYMLFMNYLNDCEIYGDYGEHLCEEDLRDIFNANITEAHLREVWDKISEIVERNVFKSKED